ncbi:MAG TPA: alpha/beta family hydrolase [Dermatophilaceae bacterium]|nr:alpha/beta family hydrolase [Dermatophilaceae bacterium]
MSSPQVRDIESPVGLARALVWRPVAARGTLALGHGAGGRSWTGDLMVLTALAQQGFAVVLVEQPWRVAGRRVAASPPTLDRAWLAVVGALLSGRGRLPRPLVSGGRSAGARVACRTAAALDAAAVVALAFPLRYPGGRGESRAAEAALVTRAGKPLLVVQGSRDPFGTPSQVRAEVGDGAEVRAVSGTHSFGGPPTPVLEVVREWLQRVLPAG